MLEQKQFFLHILASNKQESLCNKNLIELHVHSLFSLAILGKYWSRPLVCKLMDLVFGLVHKLVKKKGLDQFSPNMDLTLVQWHIYTSTSLPVCFYYLNRLFPYFPWEKYLSCSLQLSCLGALTSHFPSTSHSKSKMKPFSHRSLQSWPLRVLSFFPI